MPATWVLLTNNEELLSKPPILATTVAPPPVAVRWTDDFSDLFSILRR